MGKPRRKTLGKDQILRSPEGCRFLCLVEDALGGRYSVTPVETTAGGDHVFVLSGRLGTGTLLESRAYPADAGVRLRAVEFAQRRWTLEGSGLWQLRLTMFEADPTLYERAGYNAPPRSYRAWWRAERARVAEELDRLEERFDPDPVPVPLWPEAPGASLE